MKTPAELIDEGQCDEMVLGQLAVLDELRGRLMITTFDDETAAEIRDIIDRYAEEIYDDGEDGSGPDIHTDGPEVDRG